MSPSKPLRDALKATVYPFALKNGFLRGKATSVTTPFRRIREGVVHVFDIQWEKYGRPCFVINFGQAPSDGIEFGGERVSADSIEAFQCPLNGRLQRWRGGSLRSWFQLSKPWPETILTLRWAYSPEEVAAQVISGFSELETWWENKQEGPHIYIAR